MLTVAAFLLTMRRQSNLPETRPQNFTVTYKAYLPDIQLYEEIYFAPLGSYYQYSYKSATSRINFTLTQEELDAVYEIMRGSQFARLPLARRELTPDQSGTMIQLQVGRQTYTVIETADKGIPEGQASSWQFARQTIFAIRGREFQKQIIPFTILLDGNLIGTPLQLYLNREVLFDAEVTTEAVLSAIPIEKIPGDYLIEAAAGEVYSYRLTLTSPVTLNLSWEANGLAINGEPMRVGE